MQNVTTTLKGKNTLYSRDRSYFTQQHLCGRNVSYLLLKKGCVHKRRADAVETDVFGLECDL